MSYSQGSTSSNSSESINLDSLSDCVDQLYEYKDTYFATHGLEEASARNSRIEHLAEEISKRFEDVSQVDANDKARYYYLKGRTLNVSPHYSPEAEQALMLAVRTDPYSVDAWCELGECLWKKPDVQESKKCFLKALDSCRDKRALRNLSMVCRLEKFQNGAERLQNIEKGIELAREAVNLDIKDGSSWLVLGNAYLCSFFSISETIATLNLSKAAYAQAEKDPCAKGNPELHHNRAVLYKYEEDYGLALKGYEIARYLDPVWTLPREKQTELLNYLTKVQNFILTKGKLKRKKFHKMVAEINPAKNLGPYQGGQYVSRSGHTIKLDPVCIDDLVEGINNEKVLLGVVVCSIQDEDFVPFTFIMVDQMESCVAVTVYNLATGKGVKIGDYVAIPEPFVNHVYFQFKDKGFDFRSIRVATPVVMVVNGRKLDNSVQAMMVLKSESAPE